MTTKGKVRLIQDDKQKEAMPDSGMTTKEAA
jgi:hypothetical protein